MLMNFAEETTPPVDPATPPVEDPKPVEPTPVEPGTAPATEPVVEPVVEPTDPNTEKINALQNSLDAALEEMAKGDEPKPTEPAVEPVTPVEPVKPEPIAPVEPVKPVKLTGDEAWKKELAEMKTNQETFQSSTLKELEQMKLKDEMIGLTSEVQASVQQYPHADVDRILAEVESGSDKTVPQIAKELHDNHTALIDKIKVEQEEKIKTVLEKENEGKVKVPQSSGTSSAPTDPSISPLQTKSQQDAAWASAVKASKVNLQ